MRKIITIAIFAALLSSACFAQSQLYGLTAGQSTRADAERVLGQPTKAYSDTLIEYQPHFENGNVTKVYVQYRTNSPIIERIEVLRAKALARSLVLTSLSLPNEPTARQKNAAGNLVEYFGRPWYVVLTYEGPDANSGVARTARYSRELFDSTITPSASTAPAAPSLLNGGAADNPHITQPQAAPGAATLFTSQDTDMRVRLLSGVSTATNKKGDKLTAQVLQPQAFSGDIIEGVVQNSKSGGKINGKSVLNFTFETLHHHSQTVPISANVKQLANSAGKQNVDEEGAIVQKKSNLGKVAAGTAVGALIGGLAGGGKGAAIGAGVGGAASLILVEVAAQGANVSFAPGSEFVLAVRASRRAQ